MTINDLLGITVPKSETLKIETQPEPEDISENIRIEEDTDIATLIDNYTTTAAKTPGILCPSCRTPGGKFKSTSKPNKNVNGGLVRQKLCTQCEHKFYTIEAYLKD
ncbi:MAG: hypothetical protein GY845_25845 [Planctomycetes bacterium]|nr:hypothetical protein [Planctomycetota bacterium]